MSGPEPVTASSRYTAVTRGPNTPQLAFGLGLLFVGIVLSLEVFGLSNASEALRYWPAVISVAGAVSLARADDRRRRAWAAAWILVGGWLLLYTLGLTRVGLVQLVWPLVLIVVGVKLGLHAMRRQPPVGARESPATRLVAVLSEVKRTVQDRSFAGASATAVLGSCVLDLRSTDIPPGRDAVVDVFALLASQEIVVPAGWTVVNDAQSLGSDVDDRRLHREPPSPASPPRLVLRGNVVLSHLTVRD